MLIYSVILSIYSVFLSVLFGISLAANKAIADKAKKWRIALASKVEELDKLRNAPGLSAPKVDTAPAEMTRAHCARCGAADCTPSVYAKIAAAPSPVAQGDSLAPTGGPVAVMIGDQLVNFASPDDAKAYARSMKRGAPALPYQVGMSLLEDVSRKQERQIETLRKERDEAEAQCAEAEAQCADLQNKMAHLEAARQHQALSARREND